MDREGNSLSQFLREAWETGALGSMTKNNPVTATDAPISDLRADYQGRALRASQGGRCLQWPLQPVPLVVCAALKDSATRRRVGHLQDHQLSRRPQGSDPVGRGTGQLHRSEEAEEFWDKTYRELTRELSGVYGAMTSRAEAQVSASLDDLRAGRSTAWRLSVDHLKAALAVWNYARDSVRYLFSKELKDAKLIKAFHAIKKAGAKGIPRRDLIVDVFRRHISADELERCLRILEEGTYVVKELEKDCWTPR